MSFLIEDRGNKIAAIRKEIRMLHDPEIIQLIIEELKDLQIYERTEDNTELVHALENAINECIKVKDLLQ